MNKLNRPPILNSVDFRKAYPVAKDIGSLRRKGVQIEDVIEFAQDRKWPFYYDGARCGIPTGLIGARSQVAWEAIRAELRQANLIR